jgi:hypothetical protein
MGEVEQQIPLPQQIQNVGNVIIQIEEDMQQFANFFPIPQVPDCVRRRNSGGSAHRRK